MARGMEAGGMLREGGRSDAAEGEQASDADRRRAYRRQLPFGRGAVLVVDGRHHIVGLADVSVTGAYLRTRLSLQVGDEPVLKLLVVHERTELKLRARVVRVSQIEDESHHHTRGVAVHFLDVDEASRARLQTFVGKARR
jgi:c-di-GMP-binding flagellar brake protein YcgR